MVLVGLLVDVVADAVVDVAVDRPKEEQAEDVPKADGISKELPNSLLLETLLGGLAPWRGNVLSKRFVENSVAAFPQIGQILWQKNNSNSVIACRVMAQNSANEFQNSLGCQSQTRAASRIE